MFLSIRRKREKKNTSFFVCVCTCIYVGGTKKKENKKQGQKMEKNRLLLLLLVYSGDGKCYTLSKKDCQLSFVLNHACTQKKQNNNNNPPCFYTHLSSIILDRLIAWLQYHQDTEPVQIPQPLRSLDLRDAVDDWDATFMDAIWIHDGRMALYDLILAARYLMIPDLLQLACAKIASEARGKTHNAIYAALANNNDDDHHPSP
jgi:hypothetical protein